MQSDPLTGKSYSSGYGVVTVNKKSSNVVPYIVIRQVARTVFPLTGKNWGQRVLALFLLNWSLKGHILDVYSYHSPKG